MKKNVLFITLLIVFINLKAQQKNHISVDPFLPIFGTYQINYERAITKKMSASLGIGLKTSSGAFEISGINSNKIITDDFGLKGFKILPEFRWYLSPQDLGLSGFYTGVYYKYQNYDFPINGVYVDNAKSQSDIVLDSKLVSNVIGIELGYKLLIQKRFFVDFIIAAPGINFTHIQLTEISPIPKGFYNDLSEAMSQYEYLKLIRANIDLSAEKRDVNITLPAFRYGIKIGYSF